MSQPPVDLPVDGELANLLDVMTELGFSIGVTLYTPAGLISGKPCPEEEYFAGVADWVSGEIRQKSAFSIPAADDLRGFLASYGTGSALAFRDRMEQIDQLYASVPEGEKGTPEQQAQMEKLHRSFVNLRDVAVLVSGKPLIRVPFWRGHLHDVVGWHLGEVSETPPETHP